MSASAHELRGALAAALARRAGLGPADVAQRAAAARDDAQLAESVVQALVSGGAWIVADPGARRVRLEELDALPPLPELEDALDRRRARPLSIEQRLRLGRLYALIQRDEKGAACYRELLGSSELPLSMAIEIAEAAGRSGAHALALAGIDRVAETILTRDPDGGSGPDILRDDPLGAGALLERARDIALGIGHAPRAVALARAATTLYERLGRRQEARESLAGQARALRAAGRGKRARQVAERWRELARDDQAEVSEARALDWLADEAEADGALRGAADLRHQAADLLERMGDPAGAVEHLRRRAALLARAGDLALARATLARALDLAASAVERSSGAAVTGRTLLELKLAAARLDLVAGDLGSALRRASEVRAAHLERGDRARAAAAATTLAEVLVAAGDLDGARALLVEVAPALVEHDDPAAHGRAARARAELDALAGRALEARLLLHDAAAAFRRAGAADDVALCALRRAELDAAAGDVEGCRRELTPLLEAADDLEPRLELRTELLRAVLAPPEEAAMLLQELAERAPDEGDPWLRAQVAAARARRDPAGARADVEASLAELTAIRGGLPEALRPGFPRSPFVRGLVEAAGAIGVEGAL